MQSYLQSGRFVDSDHPVVGGVRGKIPGEFGETA